MENRKDVPGTSDFCHSEYSEESCCYIMIRFFAEFTLSLRRAQNDENNPTVLPYTFRKRCRLIALPSAPRAVPIISRFLKISSSAVRSVIRGRKLTVEAIFLVSSV